MGALSSHLVVMPSGSMRNTLREGDFILVTGPPLGSRAACRDDLVLFRAPHMASRTGARFVKRVVGLPGDTVAVLKGELYVNGRRVPEPCIRQPMYYEFPPVPYSSTDERIWGKLTESGGMACVRVPEETLFVLGDNRNDSNDSHCWGYVPIGNVIGKATYRFWPLNRMGKL